MSHQPRLRSIRAGSGRREHGQTLVVALIILGLLLILGFVFLGIINRNIQSSSRLQTRSEANDLAEAGIRYAHAQMIESDLGADWRGRPVALTPTNTDPDATVDPDVYYLRPGSGLAMPNNPNQIDLGGPDGLGPFIRVNYERGRSLVRVRYAPSDANLFTSTPSGSIRNPGAVRNYTIIESVGRTGRVSLNDPTTVTAANGLRFRNFASTAQLGQALGALRAADAQVRTSRRLRAFASIGIIESARYITNKDRVSRAAELGVPRELGAIYGGTAIGGQLPLQIGGSATLFNPSGGAPTPAPVPGFGSIFSNADLVIHGGVNVNLNSTLGDQINVAGALKAADDNAGFSIARSSVDGGVWTTTNATLLGAAIDSRSPGFSTLNGVVRDGVAKTDANGFSRGVGYKTPPSISGTDPASGLNRYVVSTRNSGVQVANSAGGAENSGRYGHGSGVYVENLSDRQIGFDETSRADAGGEESLLYDWLNPNNGRANSGWVGPFYLPRGANVELMADGFEITRDARSAPAERFWRAPNGDLPRDGSGNAIQTTRIRYRLGSVNVGGRAVTYIINSFTPGVNIAAPSPDFSLGVPFNGVLLFEGNARVRGVIPTDVQLSLVSNATIYIDGSITKGVVENRVSDPTGARAGRRINRASRSMLMLAAKDYVAVNPTMFFGPSGDAALEAVADAAGSTYSAVRMRSTGNGVAFRFEVPLDPESGNNPSLWRSYAENYSEFGTNTALPTRLVLSQAMDDGPADAAFYSMNVNFGLTDSGAGTLSAYGFPRLPTDPTVAPVRSYFGSNVMAELNLAGNPDFYPIYGFGAEPYQRFGRFETIAWPVVTPTALQSADQSQGVLTSTASEGGFSILTQGAETAFDARRNRPGNEILLRPATVGGQPSNDVIVARAALVPSDIRIEASVFAENGSFFVIPGPWFNPNPNDTRAAYLDQLAGGTSVADYLRADRWRLDTFGSTPIVPFYGEPVDVRISVVGAISENMPPDIGVQAEWLRKWGWIPKQIGSMRDLQANRPIQIPDAHVPNGFRGTDRAFVPNLLVVYDPALATARTNGFVNSSDPNDPVSPAIRTDEFGRVLPPMPRLPVSPALAYFGEVR